MTSIEEVRMATSTLNGQESTVSTVSLETTAELLNGSGTAARRSSETLQTHTRTPLENDPWIYRIVVVVLGLVMLTGTDGMEETLPLPPLGEAYHAAAPDRSRDARGGPVARPAT
jgi:hypothetical protein